MFNFQPGACLISLSRFCISQIVRAAVFVSVFLLALNADAAQPLHKEVLVFVPAYEASQLFDANLNGDGANAPACVWGNYNVFFSSRLYFALRMPNPLISRPLLGVGPLDVYGKFVTSLTHPSKEEPAFRPYTMGADFFIFDYDWRQEIASVTAPQFGQALERYARIYQSKTGVPANQVRFVIVAHSMGGLVARTLLAEKPRLADHIERLYLVGTPNTGSVKAIQTLITGPDTLATYIGGFTGMLLKLIPNDVDKNVTKLVAISRPSLYELLPTGDPNWTVFTSSNSKSQVHASDVFKTSTWQPYWPSSELEKKLFIDDWLKKRDMEGRKPIQEKDWEFCQDANDSKLTAMLTATARWRRLMGPLSETNRLLTRAGQPPRLRIIFGEGLRTPAGVFSFGTHDCSQAGLLFDPANAGDGTVESKRVLDDLPANSPHVLRLNNVSHGRLMIDPQFLRYFLNDLARGVN